jgi:hypothetical protein
MLKWMKDIFLMVMNNWETHSSELWLKTCREMDVLNWRTPPKPRQHMGNLKNHLERWVVRSLNRWNMGCSPVLLASHVWTPHECQLSRKREGKAISVWLEKGIPDRSPKMAGCYLLSLVLSPTPVNTVYPSYKVAIWF